MCKSINVNRTEWKKQPWTLLYGPSWCNLFYACPSKKKKQTKHLHAQKTNLSESKPKAPIVKPDKRCIRHLSLHNITITNALVWLTKSIDVQLERKHSCLSLHIVFSHGLKESSLYITPAASFVWLNCHTLVQKIWVAAIQLIQGCATTSALNMYMKQQQKKIWVNCTLEARHIFFCYKLTNVFKSKKCKQWAILH